MVSPSICIIDDEPDLVEACSDILTREGYRTETCPDSEQGLGLLREKKFDLVLVDVLMPRISGFKILQEVRRENPSCKIILFTGRPTIESAVSAVRQGAFDYLIKPFMANELVAAVGKAMTVKRQEEENNTLTAKRTGVVAFKAAKAEAVRSFEREYAGAILEQSRGNVTAGAHLAGLHRSAFQRLFRKYGISPATIKEKLAAGPGQ
jgi:DNA-binding NtrC family response regulator